MYKIYTPNKRFEGTRRGVQFKDGVGQTDNKKIADDLKSYGYKVEQEKKTTKKKTTSTDKKSGDE